MGEVSLGIASVLEEWGGTCAGWYRILNRVTFHVMEEGSLGNNSKEDCAAVPVKASIGFRLSLFRGNTLLV